MFKYTASQQIVLPIAFLVILAFSILLAILLKNKSERIKKIPFIIISVLLLVLELVKIIYYIKQGNYKRILPLNFCTLILFILPFANLKTNVFRSMAFVYTFMASIVLYVHPTATIGASADNILLNFGNFHAFFYHHALVLYFLLALFTNFYKPKLKDCLWVSLGVAFYFAYAIPCSYALNSNYIGILRPYIPAFNALIDVFGQVGYSIIYGFICTVLVSLLVVIYYFLRKLFDNKKKNL